MSSWAYRLLSAYAEMKEGAAPRVLDAEQMMAQAMKRAGASFDDAGFLDGLHALVQSANTDARLNALGRMAMRQSIVQQLQKRLLLQTMKIRHADEFKTPLLPPIIVTGPPRSGTTILHRLLCLDPRHRGVLGYEVFYPFPWMSAGKRRALTAMKLALLGALIPELAKKHEIQVDLPEEDTPVTAMSFHSPVWLGFGPVYDYVNWVMQADAARLYDEYSAILRLFQSADPARRLVLKSPTHTPYIDQLCRIAPGCVIVQTHRSPAEFIPSMTSLALSFHHLVSDADPKRAIESHIDLQARMYARNEALREKAGVPVCDVYYPKLLDNPVAAIRALYESADLTWPDGYEGRIEEFLAAHPQGKRGAHRYSAEEFGISESEINRAFSDYISRHGAGLAPAF